MGQIVRGIGTDIIQIERIGRQTDHPAFLNRIFSEAERLEASRISPDLRAAFFAKRFAVKEAFAKALGTGIGKTVRWQDIVLTHKESGAPGIKLLSPSKEAVFSLLKCAPSEVEIFVSLSDDVFAAAFVVIVQNQK